MAQLVCKDLTLSYDGNVVAENISFSVEAGDYLCIVGENGSGKSTLIRGLLGLKAPAAGSIVYGDGLTKRDIGYLRQCDPTKDDFPASVWEVILSGFTGRSSRLFPSKADKATALLHMKRLDILPLKDRSYRELSGGQKQRVRLARALTGTGKLLLLDEPTAGLDPLATAEFYTLVKTLNQVDGLTVIMVSHDTGAPMQDSTHVLHLKHRPLFFGTKEDYLSTDLGKAFMGGPFVCGN